jgi:uracil-DNA glycosylase
MMQSNYIAIRKKGDCMNIEDFRKAARDCKDCRTCGYLHKDEKLSRYSYPLFHEESSCPSRIIVIGEAPNYDDTYVHEHENLTWKDGKDETSKFTRELFDSIGLKTSDVLFTQQCTLSPCSQ